MRIAIYVRVSTQRQAQTQTIEQQIDRLRTHLQAQGWPLPEGDIFRDDGYSGASLTACRRSRRPRRSRHLDRLEGIRSATSIGLNRVAAAATSLTEPRTTVPGQATVRPLQRRSW